MPKRKAAGRLPMNPDSRLVPWPVKFSVNEALQLQKQILYYAKGNRSLYLRVAALNYKPKKEDFQK